MQFAAKGTQTRMSGQSDRELRYVANEDGHKMTASECLRQERRTRAARGAKQEESKWYGGGVIMDSAAIAESKEGSNRLGVSQSGHAA